MAKLSVWSSWIYVAIYRDKGVTQWPFITGTSQNSSQRFQKKKKKSVECVEQKFKNPYSFLVLLAVFSPLS